MSDDTRLFLTAGHHDPSATGDSSPRFDNKLCKLAANEEATFAKPFLLLAAFFLACAASVICHATPREHAVPQVRHASIESDVFGPIAFGMRVDMPVGQMAWTQVSRDLNSWTDFGPPVLAVRDEMELFVPVNDANNRLFFRVVTEPLPLELATNREGHVLTIAREIDARSLLAFLQQQTGKRLYVPINEPLIANERVEPIRAGTYTGEDLERLLANLELAAWTPATEEDHPSLADRFPTEPREQAGPLPDDEPGRGEIEDGWRNNRYLAMLRSNGDSFEPVGSTKTPFPAGPCDPMISTSCWILTVTVGRT